LLEQRLAPQIRARGLRRAGVAAGLVIGGGKQAASAGP
jgi:hypothetical protein